MARVFRPVTGATLRTGRNAKRKPNGQDRRPGGPCCPRARLVDRDGHPEQQDLIARWLEEKLPFTQLEQPVARATTTVVNASELADDQEIVITPAV